MPTGEDYRDGTDSTDGAGRESIWSVRLEALTLYYYYVVFGVIFTGMAGLFIWRGFAMAPQGAFAVDTLLSAWLLTCATTLGDAIVAMLIVEACRMLSERYLKRRYKLGQAEGEAQQWDEWRAWLERREAAEREGREFSEPPPEDPRAKDRNGH